MIKRVTFDFESRSMVNLKLVGGIKYSQDPTTKPTCLAFKIYDDPNMYFLPFNVVNRPWKVQSQELKDLWTRLIREEYTFSGHNVLFDRSLYTNILEKRYGWPHIPPRLYRCTAAKAAACALPRNLEGAGSALNLPVQKDKRGYAAMLKTCKPTPAWNKWTNARAEIAAGKRVGKKKRELVEQPEPKVFLEPEDAPEVWATLYKYCKIDVRTQELLDQSLPDLIPQEQEIWFLNQMLNWRGLNVDIPTVQKIVDIMAIESKVKLKELDSLTMGLITKPGARQSILDFLALDGIELPNLQAKTVQDTLDGFELSGDMHRLLEIRKALSMTSTRKYQTFLNRASSDHRVRDILMYHGASTGRDTGTGIMPHNFPRGILKVDKDNPYAAVNDIIECDPEMLRILYGKSLGVLFSATLRNMICASPGCELFVADFSKIEVAVLWWLADNHAGLRALRDGKDPYIFQAAINTGKHYNDIVKDSPEYQLAKAQVLACGFGGGWKKFIEMAWDFSRLVLSDAQSQDAVNGYRRTNKAVPDLWKACGEAAINAVNYKGKMFRAGKSKFFVQGKFLWIELPSGRRLAYAYPRITMQDSDYGPRETLEYWAVNSKTKKWNIERTWGGTLAQNITQAVARDIMMPAMVRLEKSRYKALLMIHDEGICERKIGEGSKDEFSRIMCEQPSWGAGLPISAKGWMGPRYRK